MLKNTLYIALKSSMTMALVDISMAPPLHTASSCSYLPISQNNCENGNIEFNHVDDKFVIGLFI